jgi:predicted peptidase
MKANYLVCFVFILAFSVGGVSSQEPLKKDKPPAPPSRQLCQTFEKTITKTVGCKYLLYLPEGYGRKKQQQWPMILFLHGAGERGDNLEKLKLHGLPKIVENEKDFGFIVVSPQCPRGQWWPSETETLINLLDDIVSQYDVDTERIYLTGLSMGGFGTWTLACEHPKRFAAIAPICGGYEPFMAGKLKDIPVWAFHGAKDKIVLLKRSEEMVDAVNSREGNAKLTVYPEAGHDSWTVAYNNDRLYNWFLEHRKKTIKPDQR